MRRRLLLALGLSLLIAAPASASSEEGGKGSTSTFIQFQVITATVLRANGQRGVLTLEAGIDVPDPALHDRAQKSMPLLRDAHAATLRTYAASLRPAAVPDLDLLAARLQADTDRILGRRGAKLLMGTCLLS
jgi:hypothetical protein